ncbi:MAG: hypothetical protein HY921_02985 [Elusimicrobia bacterium]|nr:hypothetical protein [Elusimicrobiota bacterium]
MRWMPAYPERLFMLAAALCCIFPPEESRAASGNEPDIPYQVSGFQKIFSLLPIFADKVWHEHIPYENVPVLVYDPASRDAYLINHPRPGNFQPTSYTVNGKPIYKGQVDPKESLPGARCCSMIAGIPTVTFAFSQEQSLLDGIQAFIHEGFHYYQMSGPYRSGHHDEIEKMKRTFLLGIPRTVEYDKDLAAESKMLFDLTNDTAAARTNPSGIQELAAVETMRKAKLKPEISAGEDWEFLIEGSAVFVELRGLELLLEEAQRQSGQSHFDFPLSTATLIEDIERYRRHYGPAMLRNQIHLSGMAGGEMTYRYGLAMIRVLEVFGKKDWSDRLFPFPDNGADFKNHLRARSLFRKILETAQLSKAQTRRMYGAVRKRLVSKADEDFITEKLQIEKRLDDYPFCQGWTYEVEAGGWVNTYFDFLTGTMLSGASPFPAAYLQGLFKLETQDKRLVVEKISIPIVSNMVTGTMRFKDCGRAFEDAAVECAARKGDACGALTLKIAGLTLKAHDAAIIHDRNASRSRITFLKTDFPGR